MQVENVFTTLESEGQPYSGRGSTTLAKAFRDVMTRTQVDHSTHFVGTFGSRWARGYKVYESRTRPDLFGHELYPAFDGRWWSAGYFVCRGKRPDYAVAIFVPFMQSIRDYCDPVIVEIGKCESDIIDQIVLNMTHRLAELVVHID